MPRPFRRNGTIAETIQSLRRIFKAIQDYSHEVSQEFGITGPQLWALKTIYAEESLSLSELSRKMYLHPSTVTGVVDRLEKKGYVFRDRGQKDRRVVKVQLTPEGKELVKKAPNPIQGKMIYGLRGMKQRDLKRIHESVEKLVEMAEAKDVKVIFFFDQE
jgi:DNA-binding MarR family transcriptional regulator